MLMMLICEPPLPQLTATFPPVRESAGCIHTFHLSILRVRHHPTPDTSLHVSQAVVMHAPRPASIGLLLRRPCRLHLPPVTSSWRATSLPASLPLPSRLGATIHKRKLHAETLLLPPLVFGGLLGALWVWKCLMMVVFQNKIIYMPGLPPNARRERIEDYAKQCGGVRWEEKRVQAADGTDLALCVASVTSTGDERTTSPNDSLDVPSIYVLYFQGPSYPPIPSLGDWTIIRPKAYDSR